jgi:delta24-sterol reductase
VDHNKNRWLLKVESNHSFHPSSFIDSSFPLHRPSKFQLPIQVRLNRSKMALPTFLVHFLTEYRGWFIFFFLLPISVLCNVWWWLRMRWMALFNNAAIHDRQVAAIAKDVRQASESGQKLCTNRPGWQTMSLKGAAHKQGHKRVNIKLVDIIEMDKEAMTIRVEPLVNMGQITRFLIPKGYTLAVLPELDELTVGGLLMGFGIESSSHKYGLFQEICVSYEVILGDGRVVVATATNEYKDLFFALPWSYGTIGFLVSATLKIIPCQPYIKLVYRKSTSLASSVKAFEVASTRKNAALFVEGLQFSLNSGVVMEGSFTSHKNDIHYLEPADPPGPNAKKSQSGGKLYLLANFNDIGLWFKKWFYIHVQEVTANLKDGECYAEVIPLRAYYHRHTKGIFWEMQYIIPFADQAWFRYLFGWAVPPNIPLMKATQTQTTKKMWLEQFCVQDMLLPMSHLEKSLTFMDESLAVYPIWLCPHLVVRHPGNEGMLQVSKKFVGNEEMYVDIGLYGVPGRQPYKHKECMRNIEKFVRDHEGYQGLYAVCYMDKEEFRTMFHHELYDACRKKYNAITRFPDVYDKVGGAKFTG